MNKAAFNIDKFIENGSINNKILPLLHTSDGLSFFSIYSNEQLSTRQCKVFNKNYLYTFYGIPSYKLNFGENSQILAHFPICFILNTEKVNFFNRVFPFDSGAISSIDSIREEFLFKGANVEDFEMNPDIKNILKIISVFFTENKHYYFSNPTIAKDDIPLTNPVVQSYFMMINSLKSKSLVDNRIKSIEVIFDKNIDLNEESVLQIIIPERYLDDSNISDFILNKLKIDSPLTYPLYGGSPKEYTLLLLHKYYEFLMANNLL